MGFQPTSTLPHKRTLCTVNYTGLRQVGNVCIRADWLTIGTGALIGLNSLALGFKVDFFTWLEDITEKKYKHLQKSKIINIAQCGVHLQTHSATPSVRSIVSDLASSVPGVLAGGGAAGDCLSEMGTVVAVVAAPGVAVASLAESSAGAGDG